MFGFDTNIRKGMYSKVCVSKTIILSLVWSDYQLLKMEEIFFSNDETKPK